MNVLVAVASRHGSTEGIADAIADELQAMGFGADVWSIEEGPPLYLYDAVVIGSAVYMGNWLPEARRLVNQHRERLTSVPVWLFSSGPLGEVDPQPTGNPSHLDELMEATGARGHRIFVGKLDKSALGFGERLAAKIVKAPEGDFRDWEAIRGWSREIGETLRSLAAGIA